MSGSSLDTSRDLVEMVTFFPGTSAGTFERRYYEQATTGEVETRLLGNTAAREDYLNRKEGTFQDPARSELFQVVNESRRTFANIFADIWTTNHPHLVIPNHSTIAVEIGNHTVGLVMRSGGVLKMQATMSSHNIPASAEIYKSQTSTLDDGRLGTGVTPPKEIDLTLTTLSRHQRMLSQEVRTARGKLSEMALAILGDGPKAKDHFSMAHYELTERALRLRFFKEPK